MMLRLPACFALLLLASFVPVSAGAAPCVPLPDGSDVCVIRSGACVEVVHEPPWSDSGANAGQCPDVAAGVTGVKACEEAWAGYTTIAGWHGVWTLTCVEVYGDDEGRTCVRPTHANNLDQPQGILRTVCVDGLR